MNAPRMLLDVEGDFTVAMRVSGAIMADRGLEWPSRKLSFRSGGLVIWHDAGNFLRLERAGLVKQGPPASACYLNFQMFHDGKPTTGLGAACKNEDATLRIERKGNTLFASWEQDNVRERFAPQVVDWPAKLKCGVAAINVSTGPFEVKFDRFRISAAKE